MDVLFNLGYIGLFLSAFLAATVLPFSSEAVFSALAFSGFDLWTCVFVATAGNFLGGMTCYGLGRLGKIEWIERFTGVKKSRVDRMVTRVQRYGSRLAFFSFLPVVGDAIAVAAGFFCCNTWLTAIYILLGKFARYVIWMWMNGLFL